jgi:hypothetical protein
VPTDRRGKRSFAGNWKRRKKRKNFFKPMKYQGKILRLHPDLVSRINAIRGGGQPLPESERAFYEPPLGYDFVWSIRLYAQVNLA